MITRELLMTALFVALLISKGGQVWAQDNGPQSQPTRVELLTIDGGKPELGPDGEGIISFTTDDIFKRGKTHVKPFDNSFKVELPVGYTLYHNLAYLIDSDAVFSGLNDFTFKLPAATTRDVFENLRILYAAGDEAEPNKPRWVDATVARPYQGNLKDYLSKAAFEKRLPDFTTRTYHAVTQDNARMLVVALMDPSKVRARFVADLTVAATPNLKAVMEGRPIDYTFKVTNNGPDSATSVSFRSYVVPDLISLEQSQGVCRWYAHNIYCNLGDIPRGHSATITFHGRCVWNFYIDDRPRQSGGMDVEPSVSAAESDPNYENSNARATAAVVKDPNKPPVVQFLSPTREQLIAGPEPTVKVVVKASDPDGKIGRIDLWDEHGLVGNPKPVSPDTYELDLANVSYGRHILEVIAEDDRGRPSYPDLINFFVNGQAKIEILNPVPNQTLIGPIKDLPVKIRVTDSVRPIKKVTVNNGTEWEAQPSGREGEYSATLESKSGLNVLFVDAIDDAGVHTLTSPIQLKVTVPPLVALRYVEGQIAKEVTNDIVLKSPITLAIYDVNAGYPEHPAIAKLELFANQKLICSYVNSDDRKTNFDFHNCGWSPAPGDYTITAVATDSDGATGKLTPIRIKVR